MLLNYYKRKNTVIISSYFLCRLQMIITHLRQQLDLKNKELSKELDNAQQLLKRIVSMEADHKKAIG